MQVIDTHQHFWKYNPVRDAWIDESMTKIRRDFMPSDLEPVLKLNGVSGCVTVQSDQSDDENEFQLANANAHDFIKGVVGWVDLQSNDVEAQLERYRHHPKMKGFRHVLQGERQRDFMLRPDFMRGIRSLARHGFAYDILIYADQLTYTSTFVREFPDQRFVIDHIAKPDIRNKSFHEWRAQIKTVAQHENVNCKISGMITEADWNNWQAADIRPYLDTIVEEFGMKRIMYGSDWPVCLLAGTYESVLGLVKNYFSSFSAAEQKLFFAENAIRFYNLQET